MMSLGEEKTVDHVKNRLAEQRWGRNWRRYDFAPRVQVVRAVSIEEGATILLPDTVCRDFHFLFPKERNVGSYAIATLAWTMGHEVVDETNLLRAELHRHLTSLGDNTEKKQTWSYDDIVPCTDLTQIQQLRKDKPAVSLVVTMYIYRDVTVLNDPDPVFEADNGVLFTLRPLWLAEECVKHKLYKQVVG